MTIMSLSKVVMDELRAELASLHQLKAAIDGRVRAIEAVLQPLNIGQPILPFLPERQPIESVKAAQSDRSRYANTGLRAAILDVLSERDGMRSPDIARILKERGFEDVGKTALAVRVYNDLWRLSQKGTVNSKDGVFSLK